MESQLQYFHPLKNFMECLAKLVPSLVTGKKMSLVTDDVTGIKNVSAIVVFIRQ